MPQQEPQIHRATKSNDRTVKTTEPALIITVKHISDIYKLVVRKQGPAFATYQTHLYFPTPVSTLSIRKKERRKKDADVSLYVTIWSRAQTDLKPRLTRVGRQSRLPCRIGIWAHTACCFHLAFCLFSLLFNPVDGGNVFLRNVGDILPDYTTSYHRIYHPFFIDTVFLCGN
jgi:hypothetical protein